MKAVPSGLALLVVCGLLAARATAATAPAAGDDKAKARAQTLLSEGTAAYDRGDYATALDKFAAAHKIFPSPKLWFNIGQANRDLGRPVDAVAAFDHFLRDAGDISPEMLAEARRSAAELKTKLGQIKVDCATDGAEITVDGKQVGSTPLGEMVWTTPGRHQVAVQRTGFSPAIEDVVVDIGKVAAVNVDLRSIDLRPVNRTGDSAALGAAPGGAAQKPLYRRTWFWIGAGALVAAGAATAVILATSGSSSSSSGGLQTTLGAQRAFP